MRFEFADAAAWTPPADVDLVFANATYQWIAHHLEQLPRVLAALAGGATLAVQMPDNLAEPTHRLMSEVARAGPWSARSFSPYRQTGLPLPIPRLPMAACCWRLRVCSSLPSEAAALISGNARARSNRPREIALLMVGLLWWSAVFGVTSSGSLAGPRPER